MCTKLRRGSISVFLAIALSVMLVLMSVLLEASRAEGIRYMTAACGNAAIDSVFAGYDRLLFDEYGLLFYDGGMGNGFLSFDEIEEEFEEYFSANVKDIPVLSGGSFFPLGKCEATVTSAVMATDYQGAIFMRSCLDFFKYDAAGELVDTIRMQLNQLGKGEKMRTDNDEVREDLHRSDWGSPERDVSEIAEMKLLLRENGEASEEDDFDRKRYEKEIRNSPIGGMEQTEKTGWLNLVLPEGATLSGYTLEAEDLPSECARDARELEDGGDILRDAAEKAVFNEYLIRNFPSFTEDRTQGLKYGVEYLFAGEKSDRENLKTTLNRLMWMREGMNLLYLLSSEAKRETVQAMASLLIDWTGIPGLSTVVSAALLAAWAYAEAILDVRTLLSGGTVPILKNDGNWGLSLEQVNTFLAGAEAVDAKSTDGLSYRDYLRILLFLTDPADLSYRAMDLIQTDFKSRGYPFSMSAQIYAMEFRVQSSAKQLFTGLPIVRSMTGRKDDAYQTEMYFSQVY